MTDFASAATGSMAVVGRRSVVVAASAGLVVSTFAAPAIAAPSTASGAASELPSVDTNALTASARAVIQTAPVVTVAADATWTFDVPVVTVVADPPKKVVVKRAAVASRSQARAAVVAEAPAAGANIPQSVSGNAVLEVAARYVGVPYRSGGKTPEGFDCSGFTAYVYAQVGISMASSSAAQRSVGTVVSRADALPGDLIWSPGHVAIYAGGDSQIDSPRPGKSVQFRGIWQSNPTFIRVS